MVEACFRPGAVALSPGETLTITNDDPMLHNLYGPGWFAGDLAPGASMSRRFDRAGTYTFACLLHAGMTGAIVVGDLQPIAASTPAGGTRGDRDAGVSGELVAVTGLGLLLAGFAAGWKLRSGRQPASPDRGPAPAPAGTAG